MCHHSHHSVVAYSHALPTVVRTCVLTVSRATASTAVRVLGVAMQGTRIVAMFTYAIHAKRIHEVPCNRRMHTQCSGEDMKVSRRPMRMQDSRQLLLQRLTCRVVRSLALIGLVHSRGRSPLPRAGVITVLCA